MFVEKYIIFITACSLHLSYAGVPNRVPDDSDTRIVFPGPINEIDNRFGKENDTHPCEGMTFCTVKPPNYPQELFNKIFKGKFKEPVFRPTYSMLGDRVGDDEGMNDCGSKVTYEPLYQVRSLEGNWLTVAQAPEENFVQLVRLEVCVNHGSQCFNQFDAPIDFVSLCKQKYNSWEFLVHDGKDGTKRENVKLPVCCVCQYKSKY